MPGCYSSIKDKRVFLFSFVFSFHIDLFITNIISERGNTGFLYMYLNFFKKAVELLRWYGPTVSLSPLETQSYFSPLPSPLLLPGPQTSPG